MTGHRIALRLALAGMVVALGIQALAHDPTTGAAPAADGRKVGSVVRAADGYQSEQAAIYAPAVSAETVGSRGLFLGRVSLPPGGRTKAHVHERHESAFYLLSGEGVELWTGDELQHREVARPGDFVFIPANVPHVAVNLSKTTEAVFIGARNEATAQESVVLHPELDARIPR